MANERSNFVWSHNVSYKSLGISKIVYAASMPSVPETIKTVQDRILKFLCKHKKDKVKKSSNISVILSRGCELSKCPYCGKITTLELVRQNFKLYK